MERLFVESKVEMRIKAMGRGRIIFASDFAGLGNPDSVNKALVRLKAKQVLIRVSHGVYLYPKTDPIIGILLPTVEEIAKAIAKRDRARLISTGVYALNKLGLSTQMPMNIVYLTDGAARNIRIGKRNIKFKKTAPRNLATKGEISSLVIQALREIEKDKLSPEQLEKIRNHLQNENAEHLLHDAQLAPVWIRNIMLDTLKNKKSV